MLDAYPNYRVDIAARVAELGRQPRAVREVIMAHPDRVLFEITKNGVVPPYAPAGYATDMPAFAATLVDEEIWSVLAYIKSHWISAEVLAARREMIENVKRR